MNPSEQMTAEGVTGNCQVCHHPNGQVFNRGKNMYGLPEGTILCGVCLGQHHKWMVDNNVWTGDSETVKDQTVHAIGLEKHWEKLFK